MKLENIKIGVNGIPGVDGEPGPQGAPGIDGQNGNDGKDGKDSLFRNFYNFCFERIRHYLVKFQEILIYNFYCKTIWVQLMNWEK